MHVMSLARYQPIDLFSCIQVTDWLKACDKLEGTLPPDDPVLIAWRNRLEEFKQRIPLLQQLASKALRVSKLYTVLE